MAVAFAVPGPAILVDLRLVDSFMVRSLFEKASVQLTGAFLYPLPMR